MMFQTEQPYKTNIVKKTVANGSIVPKKEVSIKSRVSGIVEEIYVEPGQIIKSGQLISKIKIIPNMVSLNQAETEATKARINFAEAEKEFRRQEALYKNQVIPETDYNQYYLRYKLTKEELDAAENNLDLIREGASKKKGQTSNLIYSTSDGMILDVPVKTGSSVIESNNFNEGTTIATIADMNALMFKGNINESEVGKIKEGMDINIIVGAIEGITLKTKLEYISPKGTEVQGSIQFEVRANIKQEGKTMIRAGYSANAEIVLDKKDSVIAISEKNVRFNKDSSFVEIEKAPQIFERKLIKTGLSDGINIEVISGLTKKDKIKVL